MSEITHDKIKVSKKAFRKFFEKELLKGIERDRLKRQIKLTKLEKRNKSLQICNNECCSSSLDIRCNYCYNCGLITDGNKENLEKNIARCATVWFATSLHCRNCFSKVKLNYSFCWICGAELGPPEDVCCGGVIEDVDFGTKENPMIIMPKMKDVYFCYQCSSPLCCNDTICLTCGLYVAVIEVNY
jgi:hypothetical protein